jgi:hypothetical protein
LRQQEQNYSSLKINAGLMPIGFFMTNSFFWIIEKRGVLKAADTMYGRIPFTNFDEVKNKFPIRS